MKIAIIGVGGVGGYFGGLLARENNEVTFVARGSNFLALKNNGIKLITTDGELLLNPINVVDEISKLESPDVVLICTKTYNLEEVAKELANVVNDNTSIITLQNGLNNDHIVRKFCNKGNIYPGLVYLLSKKIGDGIITQSIGSRLMFFGERGEEPNNTLKEIERFFRKAGIKATASENIEKEIWLKFVWLTTFSGITSLYRLPIEEVVSDSDSKEIFLRCLEESIMVSESEGVEYSEEELNVLRSKIEEIKEKGVESKSSMLVDIENLRQTEIESLSGTIVSLAKKNGIDTPCHDIIYSVIKMVSGNYLK